MKNTLLKNTLLTSLLVSGMSLFAQTQVASQQELIDAINTLKGSGGGTIEFTDNVTVNIAKGETALLESTTGAPITIRTGAFSLIGSGTNVTADSTFLAIGANIHIEGTADVIKNAQRGIIRTLPGSSVKTTGAACSALKAEGGWIMVNGGTIEAEGEGSFAVYGNNSYNVIVNNAVIKATGNSSRALRVSGAGANQNKVTNSTLEANGQKAYAVVSLDGALLTIGAKTVITTTSDNSSDCGLVAGTNSAKVIVPSNSQDVSITASIKYKLDDASGAVLDLRGVTLTADKADGYSSANPFAVKLTAIGNESMALANIYYSMGNLPTSESSTIQSGGTVMIPASITLHAMIGKSGYLSGVDNTYSYTVENPTSTKFVSNLQELKDAVEAAKTAGACNIELTGNITINEALEIMPDSDHGITMDAKAFTLTTAGDKLIRFGGNLTMTGTKTMFKISQKAPVVFEGGSYTLTGNSAMFSLPAGSGITTGSTILTVNGGSFIVKGTSNGAQIFNFGTKDGNLVINGGEYTISAKGRAIVTAGHLNVVINGGTINLLGEDANTAVYYTTAGNDALLQVNALTVNAKTGIVFDMGGVTAANTKKNNTILRGLTISEDENTVVLINRGVTENARLYDFRGYAVSISPEGGKYGENQTVTLSMTTPEVTADEAGAVLRYSLIGEPTAMDAEYSAPFTVMVNPATTVKAAAEKDGFISTVQSQTYSSITSAIQSESNETISISPNPVSETLYLQGVEKQNRVTICNLQGTVVYENNNIEQVDVKELTNGVYVIRIQSQGKLLILKFIKK